MVTVEVALGVMVVAGVLLQTVAAAVSLTVVAVIMVPLPVVAAILVPVAVARVGVTGAVHRLGVLLNAVHPPWWARQPATGRWSDRHPWSWGSPSFRRPTSGSRPGGSRC